MSVHPLDIALQTACPTVMVPMYGELAPLEKTGHRLLSARDGLWLEVHRPWMHLIWPIAQTDFPTPYGQVEKKVELAFGKIPMELITRFASDAKTALPNEIRCLADLGRPSQGVAVPCDALYCCRPGTPRSAEA